MSDPVQPKPEVLAEGRFLRLLKEGRWEYVERSGASNAIVVVAVTAEGKLILVEQHRIPCHARTIELPAGIIGDEPGTAEEPAETAAHRELLEETGYEAAELVPVLKGPSSAGMASELVTLFVAKGLRKTGPGGGHEHEGITVHEIPLNQAVPWLEARQKEGKLVDPKVFAGIFFAQLHQL